MWGWKDVPHWLFDTSYINIRCYQTSPLIINLSHYSFIDVCLMLAQWKGMFPICIFFLLSFTTIPSPPLSKTFQILILTLAIAIVLNKIMNFDGNICYCRWRQKYTYIYKPTRSCWCSEIERRRFQNIHEIEQRAAFGPKI